jgi:hypothetical protein
MKMTLLRRVDGTTSEIGRLVIVVDIN